MSVSQEIYFAKYLIGTNFKAFPTGFAIARIYIDKAERGVVP